MAIKKSYRQKPDFLDLRIRLQPGASKDEITGKQDDLFRVKVTAPPVEGKANTALIALLSKRLKIPKGNIKLIKGKTSRIKRIRIHGLSEEDIEKINLYLQRYE